MDSGVDRVLESLESWKSRIEEAIERDQGDIANYEASILRIQECIAANQAEIKEIDRAKAVLEAKCYSAAPVDGH